MMSATKTIKAAAGVVVLFIILATVLNFLGDFRSAGKTDAPGSTESSATAESTKAAEDPAKEGSEGGSSSPEPSIGTVTVVVDGLNFRVTASRDADLIRGLDAGEKLTLLAEEDGWLKVKDKGGKVGYVSSSTQYTTIAK